MPGAGRAPTRPRGTPKLRCAVSRRSTKVGSCRRKWPWQHRRDASRRVRASSSPSRRDGLLVTFSGLDGSGKSTQCEALAATLERLGYEASVEWTSLVASTARLYPVARRAKRLLGPLLRLRGGPQAGEAVASPGLPVPTSPTPGARVRDRNPLLTSAWTTLACLANALWHRRAARPLRGRPDRVVICDRYVLDSHVQLGYEFGRLPSVRPQQLVFRLLSPRSDRSWLLDVSPEAAYRRNAARAGHATGRAVPGPARRSRRGPARRRALRRGPLRADRRGHLAAAGLSEAP